MKKEKLLHDTFLLSIIIKGIDGIIELIGGIVLVFTKSESIIGIVKTLLKHELIEDPTDIIANYLFQAAQHLSASTLSFTAIYLILHGVIKVGLVTALLYKKSWAYPVAGVVLSLLVIYEIIRIFYTHSIVLTFLTLIDIIIIILLKFEHNRVRKDISKNN